MKAAVTVEPRHMEIQDVPEPTPKPGEAVVRVEAVGLCGSDLHLYLGDHPYARFPMTQGHELSGVVLGYGEAVGAGPIEVGERVAIEPYLACGHCYPCRHGRYYCCTNLAVLGAHVPGGLTEQIAVPVDKLHRAAGLDRETAALVEPVAIGARAVIRGEVTPEDQVVVYGAGPIGQAILLASVDRGARVLMIDRIPSRLELARAMGAEEVVDVTGQSAAEVIADWTNGDGAGIVFDATGAPSLIRQAVDVVASAGRLVIVGISNQEVSLPVIDFTRKELTVLGSRTGNFREAIALVQRNQERVRRLITHRFPLEQAPAAIELAIEHPAEAEKVLVLMPESA